MASQPRELARPVVVVGGYLDPLGPYWVSSRFKAYTGDQCFLPVTFFFCSSFDACRTKLIEAVDAAFPTDDPEWTTEVDVIGISMGGLVSRYAEVSRSAAEAPHAANTTERRLKIRRLFSLSSPHRGARMAEIPCFIPLQSDMRRGSAFLTRLNEAFRPGDYEIYPYVRLSDWIVDPENAAPPGIEPLWVHNPRFQPSHIGAVLDARIIADLARRLRGEEQFAALPGAPLPDESSKSTTKSTKLTKKRIKNQSSCPSW